MNPPPCAVLDTNVFISSFIFRKRTFRLVELWQSNQFDWIISPDIQKEYLSVVAKPKFHQTQQEIKLISVFLEAAIKVGTIKKVVPKIKLNIIKEDPEDNRFIECAVAGGADYIVSGDAHLLNLKCYQDILILPPHAFLGLFTSA